MVSNHLAVLGSPIAHSKSPLIHAAAYEFLGLDWDYGRFDVTQQQLAGFLALRDSTWRGLSITMPLKEEAAKNAVALSKVAARTGIANTLLNSGEGWVGFNTDVFGIQMAVNEAGIKSAEQVAVIGSGATARSAVLALSEAFPTAAITLHARDQVKAREVLEMLEVHGTVRSLDELESFDLTVSTVPNNVFAPTGKQAGALLDVAYDPWPSRAAGHYDVAISGLEMLLWQALAQIRIFTSGDQSEPLAREQEVLAAMRESL